MTCVKTGCHIYIIHYGLYAYGDAHQVGEGGPYFFRLFEESDMPISDRLHYEVDNHDSWWNRTKEVFDLGRPLHQRHLLRLRGS